MIGRFLGVDPLAQEFGAWSGYNYVLGNPVLMTDPDGRFPCPNCWAAGVGMLWEYGSQVYSNRQKGQGWADAAWNNIDSADIVTEGASFFVPGGKLVQGVAIVGGEFAKEAIDVQMDGDIAYVGDGSQEKEVKTVLTNTAVNSPVSAVAGFGAAKVSSGFTDDALDSAASSVTAAEKNLRKAKNVEAAGGAGSPGARSYKGPTVYQADQTLSGAKDFWSATFLGNFFGLGTKAGEEVIKKSSEEIIKSTIH